MKKSYRVVAGVIASVGLGLAVTLAYANPHGMGPHTKGGMQHGATGAMGPGAMGHGTAEPGAGHAALTAEERTALQEKMRNAKTPEERRKIAEATSTEMQKRAKEKGMTLHEGHSRRFGTTPEAPRTTR